MNGLKQTPLHDLHLQFGAKMTAFAGYLMPVQYRKGIIHEHLHCRRHAGFFDISHMGQCLIVGDNAASVLEKLTPGRIENLKCGKQKYTVLTNGEGGVIDDIIITRLESALSLVLNSGCKEKDLAYLRKNLADDCVLNVQEDSVLFALQGPDAAKIMGSFSPEVDRLSFMQSCMTCINGIPCTISRSGYSGEDGFEISTSKARAEQLAMLLLSEEGVEPIGLGARDTLRLEAGLCLYGHELTETITPIEAGLQWLLTLGKTNFPGAEKILMQLYSGAENLRVGLLVDGKRPIREGSIIYNSDEFKVGYVTSGSFSPSLNRPIAMAMVNREFSAIGTPLFAHVGDSRISVNVSPLPFVPHRYHRSAP